MELLDLPNELILLLIPHLEWESDINALCRTTRRLHDLLNPELYKRSVTNKKGGNVLEYAAIHGLTSTARHVLQAGTPPDIYGSEKWHPFALAAMNGHKDMVELLYEYGIDPCLTSKDWRNHILYDEDIDELDEGHPLTLAATYGHLSVVTLLLEYGVPADLPTEGHEKRTALHHAARKGHLHVVRKLIEAGTPVDVQAGLGETPLAFAARGGHLDIVQLLLSLGADPNIAKRYQGTTSLCMASRSGNIDVVRVLLDHGAIPNPCHPDGQKPLFQLVRAAQRGDDEIVDLLLERFDYIKSSTDPYQQAVLLCIAALTGRTTLLQDLLTKHNYDPNLCVKEGRIFDPRDTLWPTPRQALLWTAETNDPAAADILLSHGASALPPTDQSIEATPLLRAVRKGHKDVVTVLLRHGADPNAPRGQPIFDAVKHPSIFQLLLDNGADPTITLRHSSLMGEVLSSGNAESLRILLDRPGGTDLLTDPDQVSKLLNQSFKPTLFQSVIFSGESVFRLLLERGLIALPSALDDSAAGEHLIDTLRNGGISFLRLLLDLGFDTNAGNNVGYLIYRAAAAKEDPGGLVDLLLERGCGIDDGDRNGRTALYVASYTGEEKVMRLLLARGADARVRCHEGMTALSIAAQEGEVRGLRMLLESFDNREIPLAELEDTLKEAEEYALEDDRGDALRVLRQFYWRRRYPVPV